MHRLLTILSLMAASSVVVATETPQCPPLSRYQVVNLTLHGGPLDAAIKQVLESSAWSATFSGPVQQVRVRMNGVSGDMDAILKRIIETAARDPSVSRVTSTIDPAACIVRVVAVALTPKPAQLIVEAAAPMATAAPSITEKTPVAPVVAVATAPTPTPDVAPVWLARRGSTLRQSMESWASKARCTAPEARIAGQTNWTLAWGPSDVDYRIAAPLTFDGTIKDAAQAVIRLYAKADVRLGLRVHPNQCVLHVFADGEK